MFKTCIYCNRNLGGNQVVENFPVGRRLAFDAEKGRLWVVCERCRRWNLSPLDERWEAIEECEKHFRDTRSRFSTDNIGLAQVPEGLELIRLGRPQRPEFAAWRYGKQFLRRRIQSLIKIGAQVAAYGAMMYAGGFMFIGLFNDENRIVARVRTADGRKLRIPRKDARSVRLVREPETPEGWSLSVAYREREKGWLFGARGKGPRQFERMYGSPAVRAASHILPRVNSFGGSEGQVRHAVKLIEEVGAPERLYNAMARPDGKWASVRKMLPEERLALEMAAHEDTERRAFEGELSALEAAWRDAEEVAAIADRLLIPESVEDWIRKQKNKLKPDQGPA